MIPFQYVSVNGEKQAIIAAGKASHGAYIAGGTTLVDLMQLDVLQPREVIDINALPLAKIQQHKDGAIHVQANVRNSDLAHHPLVQERFPMLSQALLSGASPQLRNMATTGGNMLQRTRCPYFRDVHTPCNMRQPGSGCSAINGYNRMHAVLGTSDQCIATHPSDMCVALASLNPIVHLHGRSGARTVAFDAFYIPYGQDPARLTVLEPGELITGITLPPLPFAARSCYLKVRDRASYEFALASAAVALEVKAGRIQQARVALGGVATKPWRSEEAEKALVGKPATAATFSAAADAALRHARPQTFNAFKIELARRTLVRALETIA